MYSYRFYQIAARVSFLLENFYMYSRHLFPAWWNCECNTYMSECDIHSLLYSSDRLQDNHISFCALMFSYLPKIFQFRLVSYPFFLYVVVFTYLFGVSHLCDNFMYIRWEINLQFCWNVFILYDDVVCNLEFFNDMFCADNSLSSASIKIKNSPAFARRGLARVL